MTKFRIHHGKLAWLVIALWMFLLMLQPTVNSVKKFFDDRNRNWWNAQVAIRFEEDQALPTIIYSRETEKVLHGSWQAWVDVGGTEVCRGSEAGNYGPVNSGIRSMSWAYFLGVDCPVPQQPFRVCASWVMEDMQGNRRDFGPICSEIASREGD